MKLATYERNGRLSIGSVEPDGIVDLSALANDMMQLIQLDQAGLKQAATLVSRTTRRVPLDQVRLKAPLQPVRNVMCLGLNYAEHAEESLRTKGLDVRLPDFPVIFTKATTAVSGPYDPIPFNAHVSDKIDWEVELGIIIGKTGKNLANEEAMAYVYGYTVINDISARDLQRQHQQFFKGKSLDGSCPMGPWIVTADEIADPHQLGIECRVNGEVKQQSNTRFMIFDIPKTLVHLSKGMTLLPGDIIATGTPSGVGFARTPPEFLKPGDVVLCHVEQVGTIENKVAETEV